MRPLDVLLVKALLALYPRSFRHAFAADLLASYRDRRRRGPVYRLRMLIDLLIQCPGVWLDAARPRAQASPRRGEKPLSSLLYEARLAVRTLFLRQRTLTALAVVTLAVGLGATISIFSVVHGVLLAPLPYGDPERIVRLDQVPASYDWGGWAGPNVVDVREHAESFEAIAAYDDYRSEGVDLTGLEPAVRVRSLRVSSGYFEALGIAPQMGRTFVRDEEIPPGASERDTERFAMIKDPARPVVVLSNGLWQRRFGGDRSIVGETIELDQTAYRVIGVMPPGLGGDAGASAGHIGGEVDLWLPLDLAPGGLNVRMNNYLSVIARLKADVSTEVLEADLARLTAFLKQEHPRVNERVELGYRPLTDVVSGPSRGLLGLLFAAVSALLAIACINVASLMLARGLTRQHEMGLRAALGASRQRLFGQSLIESFCLALTGGALGLGLAWLSLRWLLAVRPEALPRYDALGLHGPVLAFSLAAMLLTVFICGLAPAARAAGASSLQSGRRSTASLAGRRDRRIRDAGVALQVALALVLIAVSGLLARSFMTLHGTDMGFEAAETLTFKLRLPDYSYSDPERRIEFYDQLFPRLDALPDVRSSGATSQLPGGGHRNHWGFRIDGRDGEETFGAEIRCVAGSPSEALGIDLLAGRRLSLNDDRPGSPNVVTVNRALVDRYFEDGDALGASLRVGGVSRTIVGILGDALHDPREQAVPKIYVPQPQFASDRNWDLSFAVTRVAGSAASFASLGSQVESVVAQLDPRLVVYDQRSMLDVAAKAVALQRFGTQLMLAFASVSLLLACVGLFGGLVYSLSQRRAEIGVRMALGADRRRVLASVLAHGLAIVGTGAALGLTAV